MNGDESLRIALERFVSDPDSAATSTPLAGLDPQVLAEALFQFAGSAPVELAELLVPVFDAVDLFGNDDVLELTLDDVTASLLAGPSADAGQYLVDDSHPDGDDDPDDDADDRSGEESHVQADQSDVDDVADDDAADDLDSDDADDFDLSGSVTGSVFEHLLDGHDMNSDGPLFFERDVTDADSPDGGHASWFEPDDDDASPTVGSSTYGAEDDDDLDGFDGDASSLFDGE